MPHLLNAAGFMRGLGDSFLQLVPSSQAGHYSVFLRTLMFEDRANRFATGAGHRQRRRVTLRPSEMVLV
jgi:hypothetical protein